MGIPTNKLTMKTIVVLLCLAAVAAAAPQFDERVATVLRDERQDNGDGNFAYNFETDNGISAQSVGTPGSEGQSNMQGSYRFTLPDGTIAEVRWVADEFGFRAESPLTPTPPMPSSRSASLKSNVVVASPSNRTTS